MARTNASSANIPFFTKTKLILYSSAGNNQAHENWDRRDAIRTGTPRGRIEANGHRSMHASAQPLNRTALSSGICSQPEHETPQTARRISRFSASSAASRLRRTYLHEADSHASWVRHNLSANCALRERSQFMEPSQ